MKVYKLKLTGGPTSMFMHKDDVEASAVLEKARSQTGRKQIKGDDRSPQWTWKSYLYTDGKQVVIPTANLGSCLMKGGSEFSVPGKRGKTLKTLVPACLRFVDEFLPLKIDGKVITTAALDAIDNIVRSIGQYAPGTWPGMNDYAGRPATLTNLRAAIQAIPGVRHAEVLSVTMGMVGISLTPTLGADREQLIAIIDAMLPVGMVAQYAFTTASGG